MSGVLPLLHLYAFMAWTVTTLPLTFIQYVCPIRRDSVRELSGYKSMSPGKYSWQPTETMRGCPSPVVNPSFGMERRREAKPQLTLGFPLLIYSMLLNVITFACHVLDQQLMLPSCAEFMRSFLASCGASEGLVAPCGVCH
jgi:hypothetical protein